MTDLKSRADELIHQFSCAVSDAAVDQLGGLEYIEHVQPTADALARFVHALCDAANMLGKSRTWAQHHSNCAMFQMFSKCDCGLSDFRPELESALAALEKGEKA